MEADPTHHDTDNVRYLEHVEARQHVPQTRTADSSTNKQSRYRGIYKTFYCNRQIHVLVRAGHIHAIVPVDSEWIRLI